VLFCASSVTTSAQTAYTFANFAGLPGVDGNGGAASFALPFDIAVAPDGTLVVVDHYGGSLRRVTTSGVTTTVATVGGTGDVNGVAVGPDGTIYATNTHHHAVYRIATDGTWSVFAGQPLSAGSSDGLGSSARFRLPQDVAVDAQGRVYVSDGGNGTIYTTPYFGTGTTNGVYTVSTAGVVTNITPPSPEPVVPVGITVTPSGVVYVVGADARFSGGTLGLRGIVVDSVGNSVIRKITPAGEVSAFAGVAGQSGSVDGVGAIARFRSPAGLALGPNDSLFVSDVSDHRRAEAEVGRPELEGRPDRGVQDHAALRVAAAPVFGRTGFDLMTAYTPLVANADGVPQARIPELGRVELQIPGVESGALVVNGESRALPIGVGIDRERGIVTWAPGPGYLGTYRLSFGAVVVDVTVAPASAVDEPVRMHVDSLRTSHSALRTTHAFHLEGWAFDPVAATGAGIGAVHVWATRRGGGCGVRRAECGPVFFGIAEIHLARPDVAAAHGAQFPDAGFRFTGTLPAGEWDVTAYVWVTRTGRFEDARTTSVVVGR